MSTTTEDPDDRDMRRRQLAKRMVSHRARTQTICAFTGLSRHRLETLRRRWGVPAHDRHRGPSPTSFLEFFRTTKCLQTATTAAVLCDLLGAIRLPAPTARPRSVTLEAGEQLCYAYEALLACFPDAALEFEHLVLLTNGLAQGDSVQLSHCTQCGAAVLIDKLSVQPGTCRPRCGQ